MKVVIKDGNEVVQYVSNGTELDKKELNIIMDLINQYVVFQAMYKDANYLGKTEIIREIKSMILELKNCRNLQNKAFKYLFLELKSFILTNISVVKENLNRKRLIKRLFYIQNGVNFEVIKWN